jgi:RNA polymerase sigma factor (sigma-70 family)
MYNNRSIGTSGMEESDKWDENKNLWDYYPGLQRYCRFLSRNQWDGDDLAQETMIKASQFYQSSQISSALLNKIAYHQWIDMLRKREHEVVGIPHRLSEKFEKTQTDSLMDTVKTLMDLLTPKQAVILMLKEAFCYQSKEIANLLETTEMAVKSTLHRAKKRLSREDSLHSVDTFWDENEKQLLFDLLYQSLQNDDPQELIERIPEISSLVEVPSSSFRSIHSRSPLNTYSLAA